MSQSPSGVVDSLEIQTQELAQDNEAQQPGWIARNGMSPRVMDGNHEVRKDSLSPLFVNEESPVSSPPITYEALHPKIVARDGIQVILPLVQRRWEFLPYDEEPVSIKVAEEKNDSEGSQDFPMLSIRNEEKVS